MSMLPHVTLSQWQQEAERRQEEQARLQRESQAQAAEEEMQRKHEAEAQKRLEEAERNRQLKKRRLENEARTAVENKALERDSKKRRRQQWSFVEGKNLKLMLLKRQLSNRKPLNRQNGLDCKKKQTMKLQQNVRLWNDIDEKWRQRRKRNRLE